MVSPKASRAERCRSLLEELLRPLGGDEAETWAASLVARYGSLGAILAADPDTLAASLDGDPVPAAHIALIRASLLHALETDVLDQPVFPTPAALIDYLSVQMAHDRTETVRAVFLDINNRLIREEIVSKGSISQAQINAREIVRRSLELSATALILAHNHPSGDPRPSRADVAGTRRLIALAREFDIVVHDHLIIARSGSTSLRSLGFL